MVAWPPPSLVCTVAVLLRVGIAAAGVMSRRRVHQQQSGSSGAPARHHDDVVEDSAAAPAAAAAAEPVMLLPELVGRLLNEAAARVDDEAIRLDDGVVWKPLREPDQVKAAGEHVSGLPEVKNELQSIDEAAAAALENDVFPSRFQSSAVGSRLRQQAAEKRAPIETAALAPPEDRELARTGADMAQNHASGSSNSGGKDAANRPGTPKSRRIPQEPPNHNKADAASKDASLTANRAREEEQDVVVVANDNKRKGGDDALAGAPSKDVADAGVQADASPAEARLPSDAQQSKTTAEPRKRVATTVDREMQTSTSKKSSTRERYSQTLPTTPTLYSMATQTDVQDAPWYLCRSSAQKKKLAVIISAVFVLVYFILCYGLVNAAREMYAEHVFEELDFL
ncbi:uncharacterized protein LOC119434132 [Dermacentor silvarum]|uniref:uncharacterized protein LOC119434132 n=1 Tax=Dermacentor silvarum TaxID=543639 RepID=UPI002100BDCE|nr:uncharacterized protein LOC119434132 [Dermacentor silvarum]